MPLCIGTPLSRGVLMAAPLWRLVSRTVNRPGVIAIREEGKACLCHLLDLGLSVGSLRGFTRESVRAIDDVVCVAGRYRRFITNRNTWFPVLRKKIPFKSPPLLLVVYLAWGDASQTSGDQIILLSLSLSISSLLSLSLFVYEL